VKYIRITFAVPLLDGAALGPLLEAGTQINQMVMARQGLPPLLDSGIRYRREPVGQEQWICGDLLDERGFGDCEDLSMRLAAELRKGENARAVWRRIPEKNLFHIVVERGDGSIVDISKKLGM